MERKLTAILNADVEGYSRLTGDDEAATVRTHAAYSELISGHVGRHRGRVVDFTGDNLLAEFASVVGAPVRVPGGACGQEHRQASAGVSGLMEPGTAPVAGQARRAWPRSRTPR